MPGPYARGAQGRIIGELHGQQTVNVLHFGSHTVVDDGPDLDVLLLQIATALLDCAVTTLLPAVTEDWTLVRADAKGIYPVLTDPVVATADAGAVGELSATSVSFASSLVTIRTGGGGKRGRGRVFLPPPGEGEVSQSAIDAGTLVLITAFLTCMAGKFTGISPSTDWVLGVFSRTAASGLFANFNTGFRDATQLSPNANLAVMRSRRKGHGA